MDVTIAHSRVKRTELAPSRAATRVISAYDDFIVRLYATVRFRIINQRILSEIEQYIPPFGGIVDLGCGFGLFGNYFLVRSEGRRVRGVDLNERRIGLAARVANALNVGARADFRAGRAEDVAFSEPVDGIVTLDLLHHLPVEAVPPLLERCYSALRPGGRLLIKEVEDRPWVKMAFTWLLDKLMDPRCIIHYYRVEELTALLRDTGFEVFVHRMPDLLPYPHVLYVCNKVAPASR